MSWRPRGRGIGSSKCRFQPRSGTLSPPAFDRADSASSYCCPRSDVGPPSGIRGVPKEPLPENRLLPNVPVLPEMAVLLNAISLFDSRMDDPPCTPMPLWLMVELLTTICDP